MKFNMKKFLGLILVVCCVSGGLYLTGFGGLNEYRNKSVSTELTFLRDAVIDYETKTGTNLTDLSLLLQPFEDSNGIKHDPHLKGYLHFAEWKRHGAPIDPWAKPYVLDIDSRSISSVEGNQTVYY